jgi:hypothetical protein
MSVSAAQGNIAAWRKAEGDSVAPGDILAEIETDKATIEWEAQEEGFIAKILKPAGPGGGQAGRQFLWTGVCSCLHEEGWWCLLFRKSCQVSRSTCINRGRPHPTAVLWQSNVV